MILIKLNALMATQLMPDVTILTKSLSELFIRWLEENEIKSNPDKCYLPMNVRKSVTITIGFEEILTYCLQ